MYGKRPVASFGMSGADKGKGGRYLIVGPEDDPTKYSDQGGMVIQSPSNNIFLGLRIIDTDPQFATEFESSFSFIYPIDFKNFSATLL